MLSLLSLLPSLPCARLPPLINDTYRGSATAGTGTTAVNNLNTIADRVLDFFWNSVASSSRPLYFHTDDASLRNMFIYLGNNGVTPKPTSMPFVVRHSVSVCLCVFVIARVVCASLLSHHGLVFGRDCFKLGKIAKACHQTLRSGCLLSGSLAVRCAVCSPCHARCRALLV